MHSVYVYIGYEWSMVQIVKGMNSLEIYHSTYADRPTAVA